MAGLLHFEAFLGGFSWRLSIERIVADGARGAIGMDCVGCREGLLKIGMPAYD